MHRQATVAMETLLKPPRASDAEAIRMYSQAIAGAEGDATLFGNRSAAHLGAGLYQDAILDARKATLLAPTWAKGFYRCAPELGQGFSLC